VRLRWWTPRPWTAPRAASWGVLSVLLAATFFGALTFRRQDPDVRWPGMVGDEATYAMQAASLAWDLDLAYTRRDYDRHVEHWGAAPDGLILQSRDQGRHLTYGKPPLYALAIAPFVRIAPVRGAGVANALFLALAAGLAAWTLERRLGNGAALWVAAFLFASVAFVYVFWVHADAFLLAAVAAGYALAYRTAPARDEPPPEMWGGELAETPTWRFVGRWLLVGVLLGIPTAFRPFYVVLLLPVAQAVPKERRRAGLAALAAGALGLVLLTGLVQWSAGGSWSAYAGERRGFYDHTGYPEVDFPASRWSESLRDWGNRSWIHPGSLDFSYDPALWGWNAVYFFVGENVGIVPYFLPLFLGLFAFERGQGRGWIFPAVLVASAAFLLVMPFNFFGGTGAVGNRYFLPLYAALWFLAARPTRGIWAFVAALLAAPFLWNVWWAPRAFPVGKDGYYHHTTEVARRVLPYETTQSHIPGGRDVAENGLWLKFLTPDVGPASGGSTAGALELTGRRGSLLVGFPEALAGVQLSVAPGAPGELEVGGGELSSRVLRPDGGTEVFVRFRDARAVHPMWWTDRPFHLYTLTLELEEPPPSPLRFTVHPAPAAVLRLAGGE
jgi:hypothetical protein